MPHRSVRTRLTALPEGFHLFLLSVLSLALFASVLRFALAPPRAENDGEVRAGRGARPRAAPTYLAVRSGVGTGNGAIGTGGLVLSVQRVQGETLNAFSLR